MKKILIVFVSLTLTWLAGALPTWDFTGGKVGPWTRTSQLTATPTAEGLQLELTGRDSHIIAFPLNLDPRACGGIV